MERSKFSTVCSPVPGQITTVTQFPLLIRCRSNFGALCYLARGSHQNSAEEEENFGIRSLAGCKAIQERIEEDRSISKVTRELVSSRLNHEL